MTWTKIDSIGPAWQSWNVNLRLVCDISSPTGAQCPGSITNLTWNTCKYTTFNGQFYGMINLTMGAGSNFGGTRNHWDIELPFAVAGNQGTGGYSKVIGRGFWHADTNPDKQGKILAYNFANLPTNCAIQPIKQSTTADGNDTWAMSNLTYDWNWVAAWNDSSGLIREASFATAAWHWRRLYSSNAAFSPWTTNMANGIDGPTSTSAINVSIFFNYMIQ